MKPPPPQTTMTTMIFQRVLRYMKVILWIFCYHMFCHCLLRTVCFCYDLDPYLIWWRRTNAFLAWPSCHFQHQALRCSMYSYLINAAVCSTRGRQKSVYVIFKRHMLRKISHSLFVLIMKYSMNYSTFCDLRKSQLVISSFSKTSRKAYHSTL